MVGIALAHVTVQVDHNAKASRLFTVDIWHARWCASARSRRSDRAPRTLGTAAGATATAERVSHAIEDALVPAARALL